jgi:hypothetical protein
MLKFGLLFLLANIFLKLFIGIGLWKMAMDFKSGGIKSSLKYEEEQIGEGDPNILRGQNDYNEKQGRIFPTGEPNNKMQLRESEEEGEQ